MTSIYDKSRVWLLGAYCLAAKDITHGQDWAAKVLGIWAAPDNWPQMLDAIRNVRRPHYHVMWKSRIRCDHRPHVNAVLTGVKIMMNPLNACKLEESEVMCVEEAVRFIKPILEIGPPEATEAIQNLVKATLKNRNYSLAS